MTLAGKHKLVPKLWGSECWIVNNEKYCGKILHLKPGFSSSLHLHKVKHETMLCLRGRVRIYNATGYSAIYLEPGDSLELPPGTYHTFEALEGDAVLIEFSTHHDDDDVERARDSTSTTIEADYVFSKNPVTEGFPMFNETLPQGKFSLGWIIVLILTSGLSVFFGWSMGNLLFR